MTRIAYLPGDGIGPEVLGAARRVLEAAGFRADWIDLPIGWREWCARGDALPPATVSAVRTADATLFGAITSQPDEEAERALLPSLRGKGLRYASPIVRLRQLLDLGVNVRPLRSFPGNPLNLRDDVDLVIFRENTEGLYAGLEAHPFPADLREAWSRIVPADRLPDAGPDTAVATRVVTRARTRRLFEAAFAYAQAHNRKKVTLVEKANVLRATGGLVRAVFHEVASRYPRIATEELHVDAACARLVRHPESFDVVATTNLFGDILSDLAAEVTGGLPMAASANLGDRHAVFEPVHGSAPDVAGRGIANPLGAVLAAALLARHVGQAGVAARVETAVARLVREGRPLPPDLGGRATTDEVEAALVARLRLETVPPR